MELVTEYRAVIATMTGLIALLILILKWRVNAFISLLGCAIGAALLAGMAPQLAYKTVQNGMGGTLGFIAPVIGLGAIFGAIMEHSGAIGVLARRIEKSGGVKRQNIMAGLMGLIAAIPVFFDVALIILLPFIKNLARKAGKPTVFFGLPLCAGLAIGHAFIPPTPGPIAIAELLGANLSHVIVTGAVTGTLCLIIAGPLLTFFLDKKGHLPSFVIGASTPRVDNTVQKNPTNFTFSLLIMLAPIVLIMLATLSRMIWPESLLTYGLSIIGHPFSALILACALAWTCLCPKAPADRQRMKNALGKAFEPTALVILVTGAGGAFKQVLVDTGAGADIANALLQWGLGPVWLAFALALILRLAQGSATVAMITAAGLMAPLVTELGLTDWQLAVLTTAIAAGATGFSHVNDSGFWLVSRLFDLSESQTLKSWTLSTGVIAFVGLVACLILYGTLG